LKDSVEEKAQQLPQEDWSLGLPMRSAHCGQASLESNEEGVSFTINSLAGTSIYPSSP